MHLKLVKEKQENKTDLGSIVNGLNPSQKKAVETIDGPLLVIAGAGSGKTRVLTHRVAYLIANGAAPWNILSLTFTNKAAKEMKERIASIVSPQAASRIWAGTFHSIFARILRREAEQIGYTNSFSIYDAEAQLRAVKSVMNSLHISIQDYPPQGMRSRISWAKNKMMPWQEYGNSAESNLEKQTAQVYEAYEEYLRKNNAMDFDDLLINMIILFKKSEETLKRYQDNFKYILVDEYQDTNRAQFEVLNMLAASHKNICVVGDDAQSIYKWRGAEIKNILDFEKLYSRGEIIRLEQNYRSTKVILGAADSVIKKNSNQIPKTLWTDNQQGDKIDIISAVDGLEEADKIVGIIKKKTANRDFSPSDFAVLYRTNAQSLAIENAMRAAKIPYVIVGGISFYKRKEVKDALAYLQLLLNPKDGESLERVINEPPRGLGAVSMKHIKNFAAGKGISIYEALLLAEEIDQLKPKAMKSAKAFANFISEFIEKRKSLKPSETAIEYIESSGLPDMYKEIGTEEALDKWNNIQQLLTDISQFFRERAKMASETTEVAGESPSPAELPDEISKEPDLEEYIQQISLVSDIDHTDISQGQVKLLTLHSAKGLEFPVVFIAGMEQGLFPLSKAELHPEEEEEERRLFYVGITRAEEKLYITYAKRRMKFGETQNQTPSKFLRDLDKKYIRRERSSRPGSASNTATPGAKIGNERGQGLFNDIPKPKSERFAKYKAKPAKPVSPAPEPEDPALQFARGEKVNHKQFGPGVIEAVSGTGVRKMAIVKFKSVGRKRLMLQYAKLERI